MGAGWRVAVLLERTDARLESSSTRGSNGFGACVTWGVAAGGQICHDRPHTINKNILRGKPFLRVVLRFALFVIISVTVFLWSGPPHDVSKRGWGDLTHARPFLAALRNALLHLPTLAIEVCFKLLDLALERLAIFQDNPRMILGQAKKTRVQGGSLRIRHQKLSTCYVTW